MITKIIDVLAAIVVGTISFLGYGGIFLLMLLESSGVPVPSEVIMPFSGFLVFKGQLTLIAIVLVGTLGNVAGSLLAYWIGHRGGRPLIEKYGKYILISKHDLDLADRWFLNYGPLTVFFGRLLPVVRTYISFPAGIAKMNLKKFIIYTTLGALPWVWLFGWLGVKMGANWENIRATLHNFDISIALLVVVAVGWYVWRHLKNKKKYA
ncbi:MAG: DedA family protein [Candidatus Magasanikbacteria bacterium]|nr:DedA family protein [Candidatus Magasanikbacteria bacterium]